MNKIELATGVYYVGAVDWDMRDFHGYATPRGITYNSYLIVDEKVAVIDAVKAPFAKEQIARISQIIDPAKIDYIITEHVEPDHSSGLPELLKVAPQAKIVITKKGEEGLTRYYGDLGCGIQTVKEGDAIDLGRNKLHFVPIPMLHWPDSMVSYLDQEKIVFSNDAFGQHYSSTQRFDDEVELEALFYEAAKYYANILMPYNRLIGGALKKLGTLDIKLIAPSHGLVWRSHISEILQKYEQWGSAQANNKVLVAYDSMWGSTEHMARIVLEGLAAGGVEGKLLRLSAVDRSDVAYELLEAKGILIGASTQNYGMMATVAGILMYIKGLRPSKKLGGCFGAYGWSGESVPEAEALLKAAGIEVFGRNIRIKWKADESELADCYQYGLDFAKAILQR